MHSELKSVPGRFTMLLVLTALACARAPVVEEQGPIDPALESNVLDGVPSDIAERCYVDFEGKLALIGYDVEPKGVVGPGGKLSLTLYWQSSAPLGPGW